MFWVISVYFNIRNILPKSGTFLLGHPVYIIRRLRSVSSNILLKGLPSRIGQFVLYLSIIFGILLFILVTCCRQFDLQLLSLSTVDNFSLPVFT